MNRLLLVAVAAVVGLSACSKKEEVAAAGQAAAIPATPNSGKVLQILQAGGYTYAEVESPNGRIWIAGGPIEVKEGDAVQWGDYALMQNFTSKSLGRTFEQILFVNSWGPVGGSLAQVAPHGSMPAAGGMGQMSPHAAMPGHPPMGQAAAAGGANQGVVKSAQAAGGYSYLEIDQGGTIVWVAAPETAVKAGDKVSWDGGPTMSNFNAKSLNRTFDQIVFAGGVSVVK